MSAWKCKTCGHNYDGPQRPCPECQKRSTHSLHRRVRRQALDEANHVSHDLRISAMGTGLTVGQVRRMLDQLKVPDDAKIKFAIGQPSPGWALLESLSFCRPANEVSLW